MHPTKCTALAVGDIISMSVYQGRMHSVRELEKSIVPFVENSFSLWENIAKKDNYCIHCGRKMYWSFYRPFCHKCGWKFRDKISYDKPLCYNCWQTEKDNIQSDDDDDDDDTLLPF